MTPITGAPSAIARSSSRGVVRLDERVQPELCRAAPSASPSARRRGRAGAAATASAPASFAVRRCSSVEKKPFASSGSVDARAGGAQVVPVAAEALVDEHGDGGRAGASRSRAAIGAGSASGRMSPSEGERRLNSAIAPRPGAAKRVPKPHCENLASSSSRSAAAPESIASRASSSPSRRSAAWPAAAIAPAAFRRIASRLAAVRSGEHVADRLRVLGRRAAAELGRVAARDPELERIDHALAHLAVDDLADVVRAGGRELVDPVRRRGRRTRAWRRAARAPRRSSARATARRRRSPAPARRRGS